MRTSIDPDEVDAAQDWLRVAEVDCAQLEEAGLEITKGMRYFPAFVGDLTRQRSRR